MPDTNMTSLQMEWQHLYRVTLPEMARRRDPSQLKWSVTLDHCFARIILDNAVGIVKPWASVVKSPATRNMSDNQLRNAIKLGKQIIAGEKSLVELDQRSLALRGKTEARCDLKRPHTSTETHSDRTNTARTHKISRKLEMADIWERFSACRPENATSRDGFPKSTSRHKLPSPHNLSTTPLIESDKANERAGLTSPDLSEIRARINEDQSLTPFRRRVLTLLTQVPRGRYSTYKALAAGIASTSLEPAGSSSARAVGNAMRRNPFAPEVPCHRILAADGKIGGFGGEWGDDGRFAKEKRRLLREEGVKFDGYGRAVGSPFTAFT